MMTAALTSQFADALPPMVMPFPIAWPRADSTFYTDFSAAAASGPNPSVRGRADGLEIEQTQGLGGGSKDGEHGSRVGFTTQGRQEPVTSYQ
jgi:hypothetical protein